MSILSKLQEQGLISEEQLKEFGDMAEGEALSKLQERKVIQKEDIIRALSELTGLPFISIAPEFQLAPELLAIFPADIIQRYKIIPLRKEANTVEVALVNPNDIEVQKVLDFIEISESITFKKFCILEDDFNKVVRRRAGLELQVKEALERLGEEKKGEGESLEKKVRKELEVQRLVQQAPVSQVVDVILRYGVEGGASDVHIEPLRDHVRVRYRLDGRLKSSLLLPKEIASATVSRVKILAKLRVDESRIPQGGRIHLVFGDREIDFRVSTLPTVEGEKVVLRILDPTKGIVDLETLGLRYKALEDVREFTKKPFGAMLISGPTGSGKSTTLYSILNEINKETSNIVTLEDPVEYYLAGVNQSQIQPEIDYTFASGLREVLRQDPNIIMVGEVRDKETALLLVHAALTGHLVFSTIHTNNAIGIIPRLLDMGVENFLIPASLRLAVAQRLLPKLCQYCKISYDAPAPIQELVLKELRLLSDLAREKAGLTREEHSIQLFKSSGCADCGKSGVKGRVAAFETLVVDSELEKIIMERPSESTLRKVAQKQGMITLRQDGILKALRGIVNIESVFSTTDSSLA